MKVHKAPWECVYAKEDKSECLPGEEPKSDDEYFEILCLCVLQAGLNWGAIRRNWQKYRRAFFNFKIGKLARAKAEDLIRNPNAVRNRRKIEAIIYNAREFQKIIVEYGSFRNFLESFRKMDRNEICGFLAKKFRHIGVYTAEYFLHSVGFFK